MDEVTFYVAAKFEQKERARKMIEALRGCSVITVWNCQFDWTHEQEGAHGEPGSKRWVEWQRNIAFWDLEAARRADVTILLGYPDQKGAYMEAGAAIISGKPLWYVPHDVGRQLPTALLYHRLVEVFPSDEGVVQHARVWLP